MTANKPVFILVRPQMGENIGAAARAMVNFGLRTLRLVAPRDGWPNSAAASNASGALDEMDEIQVFDTLQAASADLNYLFATTARSRDMAKAVFTPSSAATETNMRTYQKTGYVFGPERTGLENDELVLCDAIVTVPANPAFASLNLAQSVFLMAYEYHRLLDTTPAQIPAHETPAPRAQFDEMFSRLQGELESAGFFKTEKLKPAMLRNIRTMLLRGAWNDQEVRTFQGILSALIKK